MDDPDPRKSELAGLKVKITILQDGTANPPELPTGTIIRTITGPQNILYQQVRLDHPVNYARGRTLTPWTLADLLITPSFPWRREKTSMVEEAY